MDVFLRKEETMKPNPKTHASELLKQIVEKLPQYQLLRAFYTSQGVWAELDDMLNAEKITITIRPQSIR